MPDTHTQKVRRDRENLPVSFSILFKPMSVFFQRVWDKDFLPFYVKSEWNRKKWRNIQYNRRWTKGRKTRHYRPGYGHYHHDSGSDLIRRVGLRTILFSFSNLASGNTFQADAKFVANCLFSHFRNSSPILSLRDATLYHISALNYQQF